jgi:hypothetical protein
MPRTWVEFDDVPILFGNHFLVQSQPHEFVLSVGQTSEPALGGTPEQVSLRPGGQEEITIGTLVRVGLTRHRMVELITVLQAAVDDHDRLVGG